MLRRHGISPKTYYSWKAKYGGMEVSEARRLKQLEEETEACGGAAGVGHPRAEGAFGKRVVAVARPAGGRHEGRGSRVERAACVLVGGAGRLLGLLTFLIKLVAIRASSSVSNP